jgi:hypothetical protein
MPVLDVITRRAKKRPVLRPPVGPRTVVDGYQAPAQPSTFDANIYPQPLSHREVRNLPEGQNASDWRTLWSDKELKLLDRVNVDGDFFTVESVAKWPEGNFWIAHAVRVIDRL